MAGHARGGLLDELGPVETIAPEVTPAPAPAATAGKIEARDVVLAVLTVVLCMP